MSKKKPQERLEQRAEREARQPGSATPKARRKRQAQATRKSGGLSAGSIALGLSAILLVVGLIYLVSQTGGDAGPSDFEKAQEAALDDDPNLPGVYLPPHPGQDGVLGTADDRLHHVQGDDIPICTEAQIEASQVSNPVCYTSNPPTSGPHGDRPMAFEILENPAAKENLVHNMEHGGIVVWYNTTDEDVIKELEDIVRGQIDRRRFVVMSFYPGMEPDTIAVTSWTRLDKFPTSDFTKDRVEDFIAEHHKRFNPEGY